MTVQVIVPPAAEPVSVAEAKLFLRVEHTEEDALIAGLAASGREAVEAWTGVALARRRVSEERVWRGRPLDLALAPVRLIVGVDVEGADGAFAPSADHALDAWGRLEGGWVSGVRVRAVYECGHDAAWPAPRPLVHASLLVAAALFDDRAGDDNALARARTLAAPFARRRL